VRLLLDTHVAIWALAESGRIPASIAGLLVARRGFIFVSAVAIWEIAIKYRLGRTDSPPFSGSEAIGHFRTAGFGILDVTAEHAARVERLPSLHGDPFDRLMLAQAIVEDMQFVTYDRHLLRYGAPVLTWS
jgi:PIN domain nuclease of toxin-antitoxin system